MGPWATFSQSAVSQSHPFQPFIRTQHFSFPTLKRSTHSQAWITLAPPTPPTPPTKSDRQTTTVSSGSGSGDDSRSATHGYNAGDDVVPAQRREGHWPTPHPEEIVNSIVAVGGTESGIESVSGDEDGAIKLCSWAKGTEGVVEGWKQPCAVNRLSHGARTHA